MIYQLTQVLDILSIACVILFVISFAFSQGPICWIYLTETMTEKGMGIATSLNWLIVVVLAIIPNLTNDQGDNKITYFWWFLASSG
mmetsp:Transcript_25050/g.27775  ORF Transcript_25050/g.27775 Transcript_25050/m.27775 type:complete len:86 (+) Transcript_25050:1132-1389(+)